MPLTEKQLFERDSKRDIGAELLESIRQVKAGNLGRIHMVPVASTEELSDLERPA